MKVESGIPIHSALLKYPFEFMLPGMSFLAPAGHKHKRIQQAAYNYRNRFNPDFHLVIRSDLDQPDRLRVWRNPDDTNIQFEKDRREEAGLDKKVRSRGFPQSFPSGWLDRSSSG